MTPAAIGSLILLAAMAAGGDAGNLCTLCHPDVRVAFDTSVHHREGIACVSCHGGEPTAATVAGAHRGSFKGSFRREEIPALCASCHADAAVMRPYNLPTDQLALYETSGHGRGLARGDGSVAVCTDCHGVHDILSPQNSSSPTHAQNIAATCGKCHADATLAARYGWAEDPQAAWATGVHGRAVIEAGNASAPTCARCHGSHGAAPPGVGDVEKICGQCHLTTRAHFLDGPHHGAMQAAGLGECASCHGSHAVERAGIERLDTVCLECHAEGSDQAAVASRMKTLFTAAEEDLVMADDRVKEAAAIPIYVEDFEARLAEARTILRESLPVMHALDQERVAAITERSRAIAQQVQSEVASKLGEKFWRRMGLIIFWFYLILTLAILVRLRARAARESRA